MFHIIALSILLLLLNNEQASTATLQNLLVANNNIDKAKYGNINEVESTNL